MKSFTKLLIAVFLCLNSLLSLAQQGDTLEIQRTEKGKISFVRFKINLLNQNGNNQSTQVNSLFTQYDY